MKNKYLIINVILVIIILLSVLLNIKNYYDNLEIKNKFNSYSKELKKKDNNIKDNNIKDNNIKDNNIKNNLLDINSKELEKNKSDIKEKIKDIYNLNTKILNFGNDFISIFNDKIIKLSINDSTIFYKHFVLTENEYKKAILKYENDFNNIEIEEDKNGGSYSLPTPPNKDYFIQVKSLKDLDLKRNDKVMVSYKKDGDNLVLLDITIK